MTYIFVTVKEVKITQVLGGHFKKSIIWPLAEPVNRGAVHEARIHSHSISERIADGTHAEDNMQVGSNSFDKVPIDRLREKGSMKILTFSKQILQ